MNEERLREIRGRLENATPGPWEVDRNEYGNVNEFFSEGVYVFSVDAASGSTIADFVSMGRDGSRVDNAIENAELIANAPQDIADLLAENDRLREEIKFLDGHERA